MAEYYYLVSSLPLLVYDETPPLTLAGYYTMCREQLAQADYELVRAGRLTGVGDVTTNNPVLAAWYYWEINLRNALVKLRAQKQNRDAAKYLRPAPYVFGAEAVASEAFNQPDPAAAEEVLTAARWQYLSNLEGGHFFDVGKLIVYALKLQLLEQKRSRNEKQGKEFFDHMLAGKLTEIKAGERT